MRNYRFSFKDFDQEAFMWIDPNQVRYQIVAQYRDSKLVISVLGKGIYFIKSAHQIFSTPSLLSGFSQEEAALIGYIVGAESGKLLHGKTIYPIVTHSTCRCEV